MQSISDKVLKGMSAFSALRLAVSLSGRADDEIAAAMNWSPRVANRIFSNDSYWPSFPTLPRLCAVLGNDILARWVTRPMPPCCRSMWMLWTLPRSSPSWASFSEKWAMWRARDAEPWKMVQSVILMPGASCANCAACWTRARNSWAGYRPIWSRHNKAPALREQPEARTARRDHADR